ncbi:hypothetical protein BT63DRAFT_436758 [Microthyrium microscopicum]|uniref:PAS domain-containing protein n=1 Tax=Microthyrium microscopicum TaxID=703497 RepID=A0A6A6UMK6_9PEZI|nr:hypothetical protein BT63DRAFT_436758 [Microthyrium microscopicum]
MESAFITIHDRTQNALILYSSDSIFDTLGYMPHEVIGRSAWNFFHPVDHDLVARNHHRAVSMDKASALILSELRKRDGSLLVCETCFSVVYNVVFTCTTAHRSNSLRRSYAPIIRRLLAFSLTDPQCYLRHNLSSKSLQPACYGYQEPCAALFLNRHTRSLTIMYATSGIEHIIGVPSEDMVGRSFYSCISRPCLSNAVECLETVKVSGEELIAHLRFQRYGPNTDDESGEDSYYGTEAKTAYGESRTSGVERPLAAVKAVEHAWQGERESPSQSEASLASTAMPTDVEAFMSRSSDGIVVILRHASSLVPHASQSW